MKLKNLYQLPALLILTAMVFFTSCEKDNTIPTPVLGEITLNRTPIGLDQIIIASCFMPIGSGVTEEGCFFTLNGSEMQQAQLSSGRINTTFRTTVLGANTITFYVTVNTGNIIESTTTFNVIRGDVRNSFWGEQIFWSIINTPELTKNTNRHFHGILAQDNLSSFEVPLLLDYYFTNNRLSEVTERSEIVFETGEEGNYLAMYTEIKSALTEIYGESITLLEYIPTTGSAEILLPYDEGRAGNAAYALQIGQSVFSGQASLRCEFVTAKTSVVFEVYKNVISNKAAFLRTYEPN